MAPENWCFEGNSLKAFFCQKSSDVYSIGMVFWELADGRGALPWGDADLLMIHEYVIKGQRRPSIPAGTPPEFAGLIEICWRYHPLYRPSVSDVFLRVQKMANQVCFEGIK
jgi:hypothetical protein